MPQLRVIQGSGSYVDSPYKRSLREAESLVTALLAGGQFPAFKSFHDLHEYLTHTRGYALSKKELFGPRNAMNPKGFVEDAAQAIYSNSDGMVIVKIKTRGYANGMRSGGTMSVEVTDGGAGWDNTLCKVDRDGRAIAKTLLGFDSTILACGDRMIIPTAQGSEKLRSGLPAENLIQGPDFRELTKFEVLEGGAIDPENKDDFADRGHLDFAPNFDVSGTWKILGL